MFPCPIASESDPMIPVKLTLPQAPGGMLPRLSQLEHPISLAMVIGSVVDMCRWLVQSES